MMSLAGVRDDFVKYLRSQLVGPAGGEEEVLRDPPDRRYLMGTLYPRGEDLRDRLLEGEEETNESATGSSEEDRFADDPVAEANAWLPSSMGVSFFTDATTLQITCTAARYEPDRHEGRKVWRRAPLPPSVKVLTDSNAPDCLLSVLDDHARLHVRRRRFADGWLVTCALVNAHVESQAGKDWDLMLFQAGLKVRTLNGVVREYPSTRLTSRDHEERELRIQYRHAKTFAVGHGCAVDESVEDDSVVEVCAEVMPRQVVEHVRFAGPANSPVLRLARLTDPSLESERLAAELHEFVDGYRSWLQTQEEECDSLPGWARKPAQRIIDRLQGTVRRMESGVKALTRNRDPAVLVAFRLANRAMALQMRHYESDLAGSRRRRDDAIPEVAEPGDAFTWRPFQLAYFLLLVDGLVDEGHPDRALVDLLWFPTGGGKTEAYLLVTCFVILLRRIRNPVMGGGTAVLSRYTLSLLTTQQFQRTATTVCALEYLRRGKDVRTPDLGGPITIGLWVGLETTPNSYVDAEKGRDEVLAANEPDDRFLLERCPWCGTEIVPRRHSGTAAYGIRADGGSFGFFCTRPTCEFGGVLPVSVVDQDLYDRPPTVLLGTVDKFARLAWVGDAGRLFGGGGRMRPSLVIQDELHLLSGPLGSTVGIYEAAVLELCSWDGSMPKIIASTATIRRSVEQIKGLYGREVQLFPPAGLDARRSYFAEPDPEHPGRLYVAIMAQGHTGTTSAVHTAAAMLQAPMVIANEGPECDAYWTLVAYHNSLRELGRMVTLAHDDVPARLEHLSANSTRRRRLGEGKIEELTSNIPRSAQPRLLDRLSRTFTDRDSISFLATTNMLSVGVDIPRLSLMLMNGQPKTTAEYIQATSRVGRSTVPGLVITLLRSTKPRDRSHYETFGVYHRSLYRHIEPTSVTPWSMPARRRALHAVLVILVRHGLGLSADAQAGEIMRYDDELTSLTDRIVRFATAADTRESEAARSQLRELVEDWKQFAEIARGDGQRLYYTEQGQGRHNLLKAFGQKQGEWETPQSMRNVDRECLIKVRGAR